MKRYITGFLVLAFISCTKKITEPDLTIADFDNALEISYTFVGSFGDQYLPLSELSADQLGVPGFASHLSLGSDITALLRHEWTPENTLGASLWADLYNGINAVNNALAIASRLDQEVAPDRLAQARTIRALLFFQLMDVFGNIQAFDEQVLTGGVVAPQLPRSEVFAFIEAELKEVIPDLKAEPIYGLISRPVAQTLLAKLYLNAGVYTGTARWEACRDQCAAIISSGHYSLLSDYFDLFALNNGALASGEMILASTDAPGIHPSRLSLHPAQVDTKQPSTSGFANWAATPELYNLFDHDNDKRAASLLTGVQKTTAGDVILDAAGDTLDYSRDFRSSNSAFMSGARVFRYALDENQPGYGENDIIVFRYADVLLMQAEALNELGQLSEAVDLINQIRSRAYETPDPLSSTDFTKESLRAQILQERGRELFWEGWRRQDLIRHGQFCINTWTQKENPDDECEKRKLFPIPQEALNVNNTLVQNPGY